jgi:hypothetical protein
VTGGQLKVIGEVNSCGGIVDRDGRVRSVRGSRHRHDLRCRGLGRRWRQERRRHGARNSAVRGAAPRGEELGGERGGTTGQESGERGESCCAAE